MSELLETFEEWFKNNIGAGFEYVDSREAWNHQQEKIDKLRKENDELKMCIAYSRQFYHLPQMVLDLFKTVVPCSKYDSKVDGDFYNRTISKELK